MASESAAPRASQDGPGLQFGRFTLWPARKLLTGADGAPVRLGSRAMDLLIVLTRHAGTVVDKRQLTAAAWPGLVVDESNLRAQVATLRRVLEAGEDGERSIISIAGRGYCFVAPLQLAPPDADADPAAAPAAGHGAAPPGGLPARLTPVIGRDATIAALAAELTQRRLVSIIGAGGMGKTTLAIAVAGQAARGGLATAFVDLGTLAEAAGGPDEPGAAAPRPGLAATLPSALASRIAAALGLQASGADPLGAIATALGERPMLLLLDSCEAVIDAAATAAERLLQQAPALRILATSREPLRSEGEWSYRLPPMPVPPAGSSPADAATALGFPAVALFVERMQPPGGAAALRPAELAAIAEICRRLDGIPLALELAASRVGQLGLVALAARLDDSFALLLQGRRTALPRHQTLRATLDWSYRLLAPREQLFLSMLAVFKGPFTLDAAIALGAEQRGQPGGRSAAEAIGHVADLVDKSFILAEPGAGAMRYRCLDTTRAYLLGKLAELGRLEAVRACHAVYFRRLFEASEALWARQVPAAARQAMATHLDNLRAALDWSLGPLSLAPLSPGPLAPAEAVPSGGGAAVPTQAGPANTEVARTGMALTAAAVPLWSALGLVEECRQRLEQALAAFAAMPEADARLGMRLHAALGTMTLHTSEIARQRDAWQATLALAEGLGDFDHQLRALNGLALVAMDSDYRAALGFATRFRDLAAGSADANDLAMADRLLGFIRHTLGEQAEARRLTERMLARYTRRAVSSHLARMNYFDQRILGNSTLAQVLWLQGLPERALALANATVEDARVLDHPFSLLFSIVFAALPVALLCGGLQQATPARELLHQALAQRPVWRSRSEIFEGLETIGQARQASGSARLELAAAGAGRLQRALAAMPANSFAARSGQARGGLAEGLSLAGRHGEALAELEEILARTRAGSDHWYEPELLRLRGSLRLRAGAAPALAAADFLAGLQLAQRQQALSWELRLASSLARLEQDGGLPPAVAAALMPEPAPRPAAALLAATLGRFGEGHATVDLQRARTILGRRAAQPCAPA